MFWSFDIALLVQFFFYAGFLFYGIEKRWVDNKTNSLSLIIASSIIWIATIHLNGRVDLNGRKIGNLFLYYIGGISGTLFWYMLASCFISHIPYVSNLLAWCGENSLLIMGIHLPISMVIYGGLSEYMPFSEYVWSPNIFGVIYIVLYNILFAAIIKYALPFGNKGNGS